MVNYRAEYCPYCGDALETTRFEGRERAYCSACDRIVWHNPVPTAGVTVVDGDRLLLVERDVDPGAGEWMVPGGHLEVDEHPHVAAARELEEETGLTVDPASLRPLLSRTAEARPGKHTVCIDFAAPADATSGELRARSDVRDARFFTPEAFADAAAPLWDAHEQRFGTASLEWLRDTATAAIRRSDGLPEPSDD